MGKIQKTSGKTYDVLVGVSGGVTFCCRFRLTIIQDNTERKRTNNNWNRIQIE